MRILWWICLYSPQLQSAIRRIPLLAYLCFCSRLGLAYKIFNYIISVAFHTPIKFHEIFKKNDRKKVYPFQVSFCSYFKSRNRSSSKVQCMYKTPYHKKGGNGLESQGSPSRKQLKLGMRPSIIVQTWHFSWLRP